MLLSIAHPVVQALLEIIRGLPILAKLQADLLRGTQDLLHGGQLTGQVEPHPRTAPQACEASHPSRHLTSSLASPAH